MSEKEDEGDILSNQLYVGKHYIPIKTHIHKWEDVEPIDQYDKNTDPGICKIDYSEDFDFTMRYFRAIVQSNEISRRALELTQEVIKVNYGCYTAWYYRRKCLDEIGTPEDRKWEIVFLNSIGVELEKNYQIWHHRRCIVQILNDPSVEKNYLDTIFESDDKNYHAWSYRIWLIQHFNLFEGELEFIDELIQNNPLNNSAWSYRRFIISNTKELIVTTISEELNYAFSKLCEFKLDNEAAWVYLRGYLAVNKAEEEASMKTNAKRILITEFPEVKDKSEAILKNMKEGNEGQRFAYTVLLDWMRAQGEKDKCKEICEILETKCDRIRENYWKYADIKNLLSYSLYLIANIIK